MEAREQAEIIIPDRSIADFLVRFGHGLFCTEAKLIAQASDMICIRGVNRKYIFIIREMITPVGIMEPEPSVFTLSGKIAVNVSECRKKAGLELRLFRQGKCI